MNPLVCHLRTFRYVAWEHNSDAYKKKLDAKSHACIMMGYSKESKSYWLFDPIKQQTIIMWNVIFDEKSLGIKLFSSSFGIHIVAPLISYFKMDFQFPSLEFWPFNQLVVCTH